MDFIYLGFVIFLFVLAVSDLWVGVSNDAVNFLNSAIGSKAAKFRTIIIIAAIGVFFGAIMSNGMMDIARHGIFRPEQFSFQSIIYICLAVMVIQRAIPGSLPLLVPEAAEATIDVQINSIVDWLASLRAQDAQNQSLCGPFGPFLRCFSNGPFFNPQ